MNGKNSKIVTPKSEFRTKIGGKQLGKLKIEDKTLEPYARTIAMLLYTAKLSQKANFSLRRILVLAEEIICRFEDYRKELREMKLHEDEIMAMVEPEILINLKPHHKAKMVQWCAREAAEIDLAAQKMNKTLEEYLKVFDEMKPEEREEIYEKYENLPEESLLES